MSDGKLDVFRTLPRGDAAAHMRAQLEILDMVRAKIEKGEVASLGILMCAKDPEVDGGPAPTSSRFLVAANHLDIIDEVYHNTMRQLERQYGVTVDQLRLSRMRAQMRGERGL